MLAGVFGRPGLALSGETAVGKRRTLVKTFQEDESVPFFVLSLKAGGSGLTLTAASHVVHFDRWWNPAVENQATDRAFRIGQKRNVLVHKFVCRGTIEEQIDELIESKRKMAEDLLAGGGEINLTELADGELMALVRLDLAAATQEGGTSELLGFPTLCSGRRAAPTGGEGNREAEEERARRHAGRHRGPQDRQELLGQGLVRQPRTLFRFRQPPAARAHLRQ